MSRINLIFSLFFLLIIAGLFSHSSVQSSVTIGTDWDTYNLSNYALSEGGVKRLNLAGAVSGNFVHAAWMEMTEQTEMEYTLELFYRKVPFGTTRKVGIKDTQPINYANKAQRIEMRSHNNGRACLATYTKYVWCNDYDEPVKFTNNEVKDLHFFMDDNGNAHLAWIEDVPIGFNHQELYYWSEPSKTKNVLSIFDSWSYILYLDVLFDGNDLHLAWNDFNEENIWTPYYWNSKEKAVVDLTMEGTTFSKSFKIFQDNQGNIHLFWESTNEQGDYCPVHWTENSADWLFSNHDLCGEENSYSFIGNNGKFIALWPANSSLYYWDSEMTQPVSPIPILNELPLKNEELYIVSGGSSASKHIFDTNNTFHQFSGYNDMYYWNSVELQRLNISGGTSGLVGNHLELVLTDDGTLHATWVEGNFNEENLYYWNTRDKSLTIIAALSDDPIGRHKSIQISAHDIQVVWPDKNNINLWNSETMQTTLLTSYPEDTFVYELWFKPDKSIKAIWWQSEIDNNQNKDLIVFESNGAITNLSTLANTDGFINNLNYPSDRLKLIQNETEQDFIIWAEDSGTSEGEDLYVAHPRINLDNAVYLPTVIR